MASKPMINDERVAYAVDAVKRFRERGVALGLRERTWELDAEYLPHRSRLRAFHHRLEKMGLRDKAEDRE